MKPAFFITIAVAIAVISFTYYKASSAMPENGINSNASFIPFDSYKGATTTAKATTTTQATTTIPVATTTENTRPSKTEKSDENQIVCNTSLIGKDGYDKNRMIDKNSCEKLNELYKEGKAAGNKGDIYENRDNLHVNFCSDWTPNPECPTANRLFPTHQWLFSGGAGKATTPRSSPTLGQASYSGSVEGDLKHNILYDIYGSEAAADALYNLYINNNLFVYPALADDSLNGILDNRANTPYAITSRQICDCGAGTLRVHEASGSDLPFIELGFAGLAAFKPEVKETLKKRGMLMSTLQALVRYSNRSVSSGDSYLSSSVHGGAYMAHYLSGGEALPAFDAEKLVDMAQNLTLSDVPPLPKLSLVSEDFTQNEKLFDTPGSIARETNGTSTKSITVSAERSVDVYGKEGDLQFVWRVIKGDPSKVVINVDPQNSGRATIQFWHCITFWLVFCI